MNSHNIIIINPADEKPHCISGNKSQIKYRHGNVTIKNTGQMSFALVFRVVQRYELYNSMNHTLVVNNVKLNEQDTIKMLRRKALYDVFDYVKYHNIMKQMYSDMKNRLKE